MHQVTGWKTPILHPYSLGQMSGCLPACFLFQISGWNFLCLLHYSDIYTTFPLLFPHALPSLYCIFIYTTTFSGYTYHCVLVSSNAASTFHTSQTNLLFRTHKQCANSYSMTVSSYTRTSLNLRIHWAQLSS